MRGRLTYSNVVASIALFVALGGSSYAAFKPPKGSVGASQIRANAVTSSKVKDHSLLSRDFKVGQLPRGPQGPKGETGPVGPPGTAVAYARVVVTGSGAAVDPSQSKGVTNANVSRVTTGITCFRGLGFTPKSIVVTTDLGSTPGSTPGIPIAGGALAPATNVVGACGADAQAAVATGSPGTAGNTDAAYFVIFD